MKHSKLYLFNILLLSIISLKSTTFAEDEFSEYSEQDLQQFMQLLAERLSLNCANVNSNRYSELEIAKNFSQLFNTTTESQNEDYHHRIKRCSELERQNRILREFASRRKQDTVGRHKSDETHFKTNHFDGKVTDTKIDSTNNNDERTNHNEPERGDLGGSAHGAADPREPRSQPKQREGKTLLNSPQSYEQSTTSNDQFAERELGSENSSQTIFWRGGVDNENEDSHKFYKNVNREKIKPKGLSLFKRLKDVMEGGSFKNTENMDSSKNENSGNLPTDNQTSVTSRGPIKNLLNEILSNSHEPLIQPKDGFESIVHDENGRYSFENSGIGFSESKNDKTTKHVPNHHQINLFTHNGNIDSATTSPHSVNDQKIISKSGAQHDSSKVEMEEIIHLHNTLMEIKRKLLAEKISKANNTRKVVKKIANVKNLKSKELKLDLMTNSSHHPNPSLVESKMSENPIKIESERNISTTDVNIPLQNSEHSKHMAHDHNGNESSMNNEKNILLQNSESNPIGHEHSKHMVHDHNGNESSMNNEKNILLQNSESNPIGHEHSKHMVHDHSKHMVRNHSKHMVHDHNGNESSMNNEKNILLQNSESNPIVHEHSKHKVHDHSKHMVHDHNGNESSMNNEKNILLQNSESNPIEHKHSKHIVHDHYKHMVHNHSKHIVHNHNGNESSINDKIKHSHIENKVNMDSSTHDFFRKPTSTVLPGISEVEEDSTAMNQIHMSNPSTASIIKTDLKQLSESTSIHRVTHPGSIYSKFLLSEKIPHNVNIEHTIVPSIHSTTLEINEAHRNKEKLYFLDEHLPIEEDRSQIESKNSTSSQTLFNTESYPTFKITSTTKYHQVPGHLSNSHLSHHENASENHNDDLENNSTPDESNLSKMPTVHKFTEQSLSPSGTPLTHEKMFNDYNDHIFETVHVPSATTITEPSSSIITLESAMDKKSTSTKTFEVHTEKTYLDVLEESAFSTESIKTMQGHDHHSELTPSAKTTSTESLLSLIHKNFSQIKSHPQQSMTAKNIVIQEKHHRESKLPHSIPSFVNPTAHSTTSYINNNDNSTKILERIMKLGKERKLGKEEIEELVKLHKIYLEVLHNEKLKKVNHEITTEPESSLVRDAMEDHSSILLNNENFNQPPHSYTSPNHEIISNEKNKDLGNKLEEIMQLEKEKKEKIKAYLESITHHSSHNISRESEFSTSPTISEPIEHSVVHIHEVSNNTHPGTLTTPKTWNKNEAELLSLQKNRTPPPPLNPNDNHKYVEILDHHFQNHVYRKTPRPTRTRPTTQHAAQITPTRAPEIRKATEWNSTTDIIPTRAPRMRVTTEPSSTTYNSIRTRNGLTSTTISITTTEKPKSRNPTTTTTEKPKSRSPTSVNSSITRNINFTINLIDNTEKSERSGDENVEIIQPRDASNFNSYPTPYGGMPPNMYNEFSQYPIPPYFFDPSQLNGAPYYYPYPPNILANGLQPPFSDPNVYPGLPPLPPPMSNTNKNLFQQTPFIMENNDVILGSPQVPVFQNSEMNAHMPVFNTPEVSFPDTSISSESTQNPFNMENDDVVLAQSHPPISQPPGLNASVINVEQESTFSVYNTSEFNVPTTSVSPENISLVYNNLEVNVPTTNISPESKFLVYDTSEVSVPTTSVSPESTQKPFIMENSYVPNSQAPEKNLPTTNVDVESKILDLNTPKLGAPTISVSPGSTTSHVEYSDHIISLPTPPHINKAISETTTLAQTSCTVENCSKKECNNIYVIPDRSVDIINILKLLNVLNSTKEENSTVKHEVPILKSRVGSSDMVGASAHSNADPLSDIKTMFNSIQNSVLNGNADNIHLRQSISQLLSILKERRAQEYNYLSATKLNPNVGYGRNNVVMIMQINEYIELLELMMVYLARDPAKLLDESKDARISNFESPYPSTDPHRRLIEDQFYYVHPKILNEFIDVYKKYSKDDDYYGTPMWQFSQENGRTAARRPHRRGETIGKWLNRLLHLNGLLPALTHNRAENYSPGMSYVD